MNRTITPTEVAAAVVVARARLYVEAMQDATAVKADHPEYELRRDRVVKSFLALQDSDTWLAVVFFLGGLVVGCILMWSVMAVAARAASGGSL